MLYATEKRRKSLKKYFEKNYRKITYPIDTPKVKGLRNAQLGAIHAISSFFTLRKKEAAIVIMPTGAGKTAVLMLTPYLLRKNKVLIVTPSKMVRGQIFEDLSSLKTLCYTNVFSPSMSKPKVYEMEHRYKDEFLPELEMNDAIVATPQCALSLSETEWAKENIELVLIDEAHHTPAKTWEQILINLSQATHVLFTATPFRMDRKEIKGDIIYDYPLSQAYADGVFGEIQYVPVEAKKDKDIIIAQKAEEVLLNDRDAGYIHYLMVRTDTKENAAHLEEIYQKYTSLRLKKIDSSMSHITIKKYLSDLHNGQLDGIICVDMLGEGYDFPNLKIAAVHAPHKSLASTLQFIGRFARTNASNIGTAKFIAANDEELEIENNKLYTTDAVWQDMIIGMSEGKNQTEVEKKNYYKEFVGNSECVNKVPLHAIRPNCHVKIYRARGFELQNDFPESFNVGNRILKNVSENTIVGIGLDYLSPLWMGNGDKINQEYILYILHYQDELGMLYIYSQKHTEAVYDELVSSFCEWYEQIPKSEIYRVLGGLKNFKIFNSGMLNKQSESGEAYRIMAGSDVSEAIDPESGRLYAAGHSFCKAVENDSNESITIGYSSASKVWSSAYCDLQDYIKWCDGIGKKISNKEIKVKTNTNFDFLPHPSALTEYPSNIFYADYSPKTYSSIPMVKCRGEETGFRLIDYIIKIVSSTKNKLQIELSAGENIEEIECDLNGRYKSITNILSVRNSVGWVGVADYLTDNPLIFRTLDDQTIEGINVLTGDFSENVFDNSIVEPINWETYGTDIHVEFGKSQNDTAISIQDALLEILKSKNQYDYIIFDHGTGELADYITIQETEHELYIELYHVKKMSGAQFNSSVNDIYEVAGQAIKSTSWFTTKGKFIQKIVDRHKAGHCQILVGGEYQQLIRNLRSSEKLLRGTIVIVQPAISVSIEIPNKIQQVLAATTTYIKRAGKVNALKITGSK